MATHLTWSIRATRPATMGPSSSRMIAWRTELAGITLHTLVRRGTAGLEHTGWALASAGPLGAAGASDSERASYTPTMVRGGDRSVSGSDFLIGALESALAGAAGADCMAVTFMDAGAVSRQ